VVPHLVGIKFQVVTARAYSYSMSRYEALVMVGNEKKKHLITVMD
jgi:hypothetical protein